MVLHTIASFNSYFIVKKVNLLEKKLSEFLRFQKIIAKNGQNLLRGGHAKNVNVLEISLMIIIQQFLDDLNKGFRFIHNTYDCYYVSEILKCLQFSQSFEQNYVDISPLCSVNAIALPKIDEKTRSFEIIHFTFPSVYRMLSTCVLVQFLCCDGEFFVCICFHFSFRP